MRILGVDCGSRTTGYGIIESDGKVHLLIASGIVRMLPGLSLADRLNQIHERLSAVAQAHAPDAFAVEEVFHAVNVKSALRLAHVRGVALLAAAQLALPVGEYSALAIKDSVVGYGRADKAQVQRMVSSLLGLREPLRHHDEADACAVAICHATRTFSAAALSR